jgi:predicted ATP-dependent endonuclease of OLD family
MIMKIHTVAIKNYGPFRILEEVRLGQLATIVGKNDTGKSTILRALQLFLNGSDIDLQDIYCKALPSEPTVIEVSFNSLPEHIRIEAGVSTTFKQEMLLDSFGNLRIRKVYSRNDPSPKISLITQDYQDQSFAGLAKLKEAELNERCRALGITAPQAGRGIKNKTKRKAVRALALQQGTVIGPYELELSKRDSLWGKIKSRLPTFYLFETETKTDTQESSFQRQFRPIVEQAAANRRITKSRNQFKKAIESGLQKEIDQVFLRLRKHTDALTSLKAKPIFTWDAAVGLQIYGKDRYGIIRPLEKRGSGIRRLLMVAFFEHLAEKHEGKTSNFVFGIEEPENNLHPGLQRDLSKSFRLLANQGCQVIVTTHSAVLAGDSPLDDLTLIVRERGTARAIQCPELDLYDVGEELGVEPSDQIIGYDACVFVEGGADVFFYRTVASKLKGAQHIPADFADRNIGLIPVGGDNLKCWMDVVALRKLTRRFAIVIDSERKSVTDPLPGQKCN